MASTGIGNLVKDNILDLYYNLMIKKYIHGMINEGWSIALSHNVVYDQNNAVRKNYRIIISTPEISQKTFINAINNARLHGIICTDTGDVLNIDEKIFNENICLWQAKELGLL